MTTGTGVPHTRSGSGMSGGSVAGGSVAGGSGVAGAGVAGSGTRPGLRRRLPEQEPPYDDEIGVDGSTGLPPPTAVPTDTAPRELGVGLVAPTPPLALRRQRGQHAGTARPLDAGSAVDGSDGRFHPVPRPAAAVVTRALLEVVCGLRPVAQLASWTTPQLHAELVRVCGTVPSRRRYVVRSIRVTEPRPGVAEIVAVVAREGRAAAVALRMEVWGGRWRVTRFQLG